MEVHKDVVKIFAVDSLQLWINKWFAELQQGRDSPEDKPWPSPPKISNTDE